MTLLYAYIEKYKNYVTQAVTFDSSYTVQFEAGLLTITYRGRSEAHALLPSDSLQNLHLIVGKTGSGKTNLLQLIGAKHDTRHRRIWDGEEDAYFFLYQISATEFFLEICNLSLVQFEEPTVHDDHTLPKSIRENARRTNSIRTVHFSIPHALSVGESISSFQIIRESKARTAAVKRVREQAIILNCYDIHSFIQPPYPDEKETFDDFRNDWIGRAIVPYHRTTLWKLCDYIREYIAQVEHGTVKREVSFVLSTHNFAEQYPLKLPNAVEADYWTFSSLARDQKLSSFDDDARNRLKKYKKQVKKMSQLSQKDLFLHDLWTDYAMYLRKWVAKIENFNKEEEIPENRLDYSGTRDVYQEFIDYYTAKEYRDTIDPTVVPDGLHMSIVRRCKWLAEYIDRADNGDPHGLLWQIFDDLKDISNLLRKLDDRYFTMDTCAIPVVDMALPAYREVFYELFERMEQYRPDDAGIFTNCLLPYHFTHLSTGEFQYAKVLGGLDQNLQLSSESEAQLDKIILMDEPEAYMHPELTRQFMQRLHDIIARHPNHGTIQIIIGTHSPFLVSDVLADNLTRLTIDPETGGAIVLPRTEKEYFGANMYTVFSDSFFLDYTIGEFSRCFLQNHMDTLKALIQRSSYTPEEEQYLRQLRGFLSYIGDPMIRRAFAVCLDQCGR